MSVLDLKKLLLGTTVFLSASALAFPAAYAQDDDDGVSTISEEEEAAVEDDDDETIVITGSRIRRDTFSSISPLQVITTEESLDAGLIDPSQILQQSEAAAGTQIDTSFQGFVLDNGPGSATLNLRGLGAGRTLLLINGRRMAPAGVEGAPTQPSINLLPGSLIERYDLLLDGASSVYGSDAVAGVGNIILKKDFEGLELFASGDYNVAGAGNDYTLSAAWGKNNDRGFFGVGVEYDYTDEVTFRDREFLSGCDSHYEITEDGQIRTIDLATAAITERNTQGLISERKSQCKAGAGGYSNRIFAYDQLAFGSAYYTPGIGNLLPDFSDTGLYSVPIDSDGDGLADVYFPDFSPGDTDLDQSLLAEQAKLSVMGYGEYTFEGPMNVTPYFELLYVQNDINGNAGQPTLFPRVPRDNPYNVCNPNGIGDLGAYDCYAAEDALLQSDYYVEAFRSYYNGGGGSANCFGLGDLCHPDYFGLYNSQYGLSGPAVVSANVNVMNDRNLTDVTLKQTRGVAGVRGDLPFLNFGSLSDWGFDASLVYSRGEGTSSRLGIRDDRLALALGWDPTTDLNDDGVPDGDTINADTTLLELPGGACDVANVSSPDLLASDAAAGCVPVNLFARSLYGGIGGTFATQAETDYLFDSRDFDTVYEQTIFNAYATGQLLELPAGPLSAVAGVEYRVDSIDSQPDNVAEDGLFFGFFADAGASGEKWTREAFFEFDLPLIADKPLIKQLDLNASARITEDEFYGSAWTYSYKAGYRPSDSLLLKASYGTSFRAPNLRENFINGQSGFNNGLGDPCAVPLAAMDPTPGGGFTYNAANDPRVQQNPHIISNCLREGRDPTTVGFNFNTGQASTVVSAEVETGGTDDIGPERSNSFTAGFAWEQPIFESFDLNIGVNFYDIEIEDSIIEPTSQFIVNDCFLRQDTSARSPFCDRLTYSGARGTIGFINAGFLNQDQETVSGLDYNVTFGYEFEAFDQPFDFGVNLRANQLKERSTKFVGDDLSVTEDEDAGEFGFPEWTATGTFNLDFSDYRLTWQTRYIGEVSTEADQVDEFSDALDTPGVGFIGDTCLGPDAGDVLCRDVGWAEKWFEHAASIRYTGDTWTIRAGVSNIFDKKPPLVDSNEVFAVSNTPIGNGYDLDGREYFFVLSKDFN